MFSVCLVVIVVCLVVYLGEGRDQDHSSEGLAKFVYGLVYCDVIVYYYWFYTGAR